jgi:molybdate transport system substrate-binding protein
MPIKNIYSLILIVFITTFSGISAASDHKVVVFAAASLTNAITDIAKAYEAKHAIKIQKSFASSAALAKQITRGAPADIYLSADQQWMDYLHTKRFITPNSRQDLLKNHLVLISPAQQSFNTKMVSGYPFAAQFKGKLCTGQVDSVPVGIYAKQALTHLNWWHSVKSRLVGAQSVRTALVYVERGECKAGIVYETDAKISNKVKIIARFPADSHTPIRYPMALVNNANPQAKDFMLFLNSAQASAIFKQYGFITLQ